MLIINELQNLWRFSDAYHHIIYVYIDIVLDNFIPLLSLSLRPAALSKVEPPKSDWTAKSMCLCPRQSGN
jgi:hypothetical protein